MEPGRLQPVAIVRRSREFVEHQMHLFIGKLIRGRVGGVSSGKPMLNFGSFALPFESELDLKDGEIATFRVIGLSGGTITMSFVRREGAVDTAVEKNLDAKVKALLTELRLPVDKEHAQAVRDLLKAGFTASRENIRAAVTLKADPGGEGTASRILRGLLLNGADIPPKILAALREYIAALPKGETLPENAFAKTTPDDIASLAAKLGSIRGQDNLSVDIQVLARRIMEGLKPISTGEPADVAKDYSAAAGKRVGAEAAMVRAFQAFIPKFVSGLHPNDPLRAVFEQFTAAVREIAGSQAQPAAATAPAGLQPLPLEVIPAFIEYILGEHSAAGGLKYLLSAFANYIRNIVSHSDALAPTGADAKELQGNASLNLGRIAALIQEHLGGSETASGKDLLNSLVNAVEALSPRVEGARVAEWLMTPGRPGAENLPVVGFDLRDGGKGSISLHPGVRRREEDGDEVPAGGRLVYEGDGVGRIEIGLEYGSDGLSTIFLTERRDVHESIQAGLPELTERIIARGIQVKSLRSVLRVRREEADAGKPARLEDSINGGLDVKA